MTQIDYARKQIITQEMEAAARHDNTSARFIAEGLREGTIVLPANNNRRFPRIRAIGPGLKTKVNANIGTSNDHCCINEELKKVETAVKLDVDSIMDLSTGEDADTTLHQILKKADCMVGTVSLYIAIAGHARQGGTIADFEFKSVFDEIRKQVQAGVDFMTIHCGITKTSLSFLNTSDRVAGVVSRGGSFIARWMRLTGRENPLYENFDELLEIASAHDVTISLGDGFRPGGQCDATDSAQVSELLELGRLVKRAQDKNVQVMVEGPGHMPYGQIAMNVELQKRLCHNAPFYVLGPLVTDIASGYDHITAAIGGCAAAGADFLCYVTPAEHLCLPTVEDVKQGVIAAKIAAHAADVSLGLQSAAQLDTKVTRYRTEFDWENVFAHSLDPELPRTRRKESECNDDEYCSMCGSLCAVRTSKGDND